MKQVKLMEENKEEKQSLLKLSGSLISILETEIADDEKLLTELKADLKSKKIKLKAYKKLEA